MESKELKYDLYIGAAPEKVWDLLVSPEGCRQLFFGCELQSSFEVGAPYAYVGPGADGDATIHVYGNILTFEPHQSMSYTEHPGPSYYENHEELETRVSLYLELAGNSTKVTLVNDNWPDNHPGYSKAADSWVYILSNLKTLAETGKTLDLGW
ncbi:hypothetical protein D3C78_575110 [compost metagenome]